MFSMLICAGTRYFSSAVSVIFVPSFWSSGSLHHRRVWVRSWTTLVVGFAAGISAVYAKNSTLVSWSLPTVCRGYSTILHINNGTNLVFDELLSCLFSSIGGIVYRGIVSSRSIHWGIHIYSRQGRFTDLRRKYFKQRIWYYPNSSAGFNFRELCISLSGDIHPSPGTDTSSSRIAVIHGNRRTPRIPDSGGHVSANCTRIQLTKNAQSTVHKNQNKLLEIAQQLWMQVQNNKLCSLRVCVVYRPPEIGTACLENELLPKYIEALSRHKYIVLTGDLNSDLLSENPRGEALLSFCAIVNATQLKEVLHGSHVGWQEQ